MSRRSCSLVHSSFVRHERIWCRLHSHLSGSTGAVGSTRRRNYAFFSRGGVTGGGSYCRQNGELSIDAQAACLLEFAEGEDEAETEAVVRANMKSSWFLR